MFENGFQKRTYSLDVACDECNKRILTHLILQCELNYYLKTVTIA